LGLPLAEQPAEERIRRGVGRDDVPVPVHHHCREGFVSGEHAAERRAHLCGLCAVQARLTVEGLVAGGEQELVALADGHVQRACQPQHHLRLGCDRPLSMKLR
jgi:hypothetical protein